MEENIRHHYVIIGKKTNHLIWEGVENNDLLNYDTGIDVLLLINYKNQQKNFSIPDNFLYVDYETEEPKEELYELMRWCPQQRAYVFISDTKSIINSKSESVAKRMSEIESHIHSEYVALMDFSKNLIQEIKNSKSIEKIYEIANDPNNQYSSIAKFILSHVNNKEIDNETLVKEYGCIRKTTNMLGMLLTSLKNQTQKASENLKETGE